MSEKTFKLEDLIREIEKYPLLASLITLKDILPLLKDLRDSKKKPK